MDLEKDQQEQESKASDGKEEDNEDFVYGNTVAYNEESEIEESENAASKIKILKRLLFIMVPLALACLSIYLYLHLFVINKSDE